MSNIWSSELFIWFWQRWSICYKSELWCVSTIIIIRGTFLNYVSPLVMTWMIRNYLMLVISVKVFQVDSKVGHAIMYAPNVSVRPVLVTHAALIWYFSLCSLEYQPTLFFFLWWRWSDLFHCLNLRTLSQLTNVEWWVNFCPVGGGLLSVFIC